MITYELQYYHDDWFDGEWETKDTYKSKGSAMKALAKAKRHAVFPENYQVVAYQEDSE